MRSVLFEPDDSEQCDDAERGGHDGVDDRRDLPEVVLHQVSVEVFVVCQI